MFLPRGRGHFLSLRTQCDLSSIFRKLLRVQNLPTLLAKEIQVVLGGGVFFSPYACDFGCGRTLVISGSLIFFGDVLEHCETLCSMVNPTVGSVLKLCHSSGNDFLGSSSNVNPVRTAAPRENFLGLTGG